MRRALTRGGGNQSGGNVDWTALIEILCTSNPRSLMELRSCYALTHPEEHSLEEAIGRHAVHGAPLRKRARAAAASSAAADEEVGESALPLLCALVETAHESEALSAPHMVQSDVAMLHAALSAPPQKHLHAAADDDTVARLAAIAAANGQPADKRVQQRVLDATRADGRK